MTGERKMFSVTQVNEYIKMLIDGERALSHILIRGEISNFKNHYATGHFYFTLKDEGSSMKAVMFRSAAQKLGFVPRDGMKVIVNGACGRMGNICSFPICPDYSFCSFE